MRKKILLVEDDKTIRGTTREILGREGYEVKTEGTIDEAWERL